MIKKLIALFVMSLIFCTFSFAQETSSPQMSSIPLFQAFFESPVEIEKPYVIGDISFADYDFVSSFELGARGGLLLSPKIQLGSEISFISLSPDNGDGESGISDLLVQGKYTWMLEKSRVAAGGKITLPIGSEDVGGGNTNFGMFGGIRHPLSPKATMNGVLGINFIEAGKDRETSLMLGFGGTMIINNQISAVGEFNLQTEVEYAMLSFGVDYQLKEMGRIRSGIGIGMDDGAPDIQIKACYLFDIK
ncbi:MAG: transporter [Candidatus Cloacimonetes bacterium]|nr:transporter [Candidatus Cloacimonadota bacterium]MBS3767104.1 transporter [Candidatus Cloacimonadota bacterium]